MNGDALMGNELGGTSASAGNTAGGLLRAAREKQGLHIAALAASIKVAPRKLEALERDRYEDLSGTIFTRALAQSVCRALRIDAKPVLALLPQPVVMELGNVTGTLNAPFRDRPSRDEPGVLAMAQRSLIWTGLALLVAAAATYFVPLSLFKSAATVAPTAAAPSIPDVNSALATAAPQAASTTSLVSSASAPSPVSARLVSGAAEPAALTSMSANGPAAAAQVGSLGLAASALQITTTESSWIEVRDGKGNLLLSRIVLPSEPVGLDGAPPLRLVIGNAGVTQVQFRGKPVDVAAGTRENVARLELN